MAAQTTGLGAAAAASGRPRECAPAPRRGSHRPSVWQRVRVPNLGRYCDLIARAQAQLATAPGQARAAAREADATMPGRAATAVILARAALALGEVDEA